MEAAAESSAESVIQCFRASVAKGRRILWPYVNWLLTDCLPDDAVDAILSLPFEAPSLDGVSGKRELHNNTRKYFDAENRNRFPVCNAVARAFQDKRVTSTIETAYAPTYPQFLSAAASVKDPSRGDRWVAFYIVEDCPFSRNGRRRVGNMLKS